MRFNSLTFTLCLFITLAGSCGALAFELQDGFVAAKKIDSRYFSIQLASGVEELSLIQTLGIGPQDRILAGQASVKEQFRSGDLGDLLDSLFLWSSSVLDMQLFSYRGNIKIVPDENALAGVYRKIYGGERKGDKAFYIYEGNTIYVAQENFTREIVGHEMGHVIISNYFVVQPPMKVQEVLAGYIEYQLRKTSLQK